nr:transposase [Lentibacter algarum]
MAVDQTATQWTLFRWPTAHCVSAPRTGDRVGVRDAAARLAVDDPVLFRSSKRIGSWIGLTPSRNQSGERDVSGGITKAGDVNLRRA